MTEAERLQNEYLRERREQKRTQSLRVRLALVLAMPGWLAGWLTGWLVGSACFRTRDVPCIVSFGSV